MGKRLFPPREKRLELKAHVSGTLNVSDKKIVAEEENAGEWNGNALFLYKKKRKGGNLTPAVVEGKHGSFLKRGVGGS